MSSSAKSIHPDAERKSAAPCLVCHARRSCGLGACDEHTVYWSWWQVGHATPHDAAFAHLVRLDEVLEQEPRRPAAIASTLSLWLRRFLDREAVALESAAIGADRTRLDLQLYLTDWRRGGVA